MSENNPNPCRCIDCGGTEPAHSKDCTYMAEMFPDEALAVYITLDKVDGYIGLNHRNQLIVGNRTSCTNLGPLTQQRAEELGEYLNRLAIHTPER